MRKPAHPFRAILCGLALLGAGVVGACSINPQPLPPGLTGNDDTTGGSEPPREGADSGSLSDPTTGEGNGAGKTRDGSVVPCANCGGADAGAVPVSDASSGADGSNFGDAAVDGGGKDGSSVVDGGVDSSDDGATSPDGATADDGGEG
ncbi:MAG: hypothetical protein U0169_16875 [Polyangiaceae bacterium]